MQETMFSIIQMRFPQKLWYLLDAKTAAIIWSATGRTILLNYKILDCYLRCETSIFKTTHISSFIRQLNLYGFRKVTSHLQDPLCNSSNPDMHEYVHDFFQNGRPDLLINITRKALHLNKMHKPTKRVNLCTTQLQRARRTLRFALKRAVLQFNLNYTNCPSNYLSGEEAEDSISESILPEPNDNVQHEQLDWIACQQDVEPKTFQNPYFTPTGYMEDGEEVCAPDYTHVNYEYNYEDLNKFTENPENCVVQTHPNMMNEITITCVDEAISPEPMDTGAKEGTNACMEKQKDVIFLEILDDQNLIKNDEMKDQPLQLSLPDNSNCQADAYLTLSELDDEMKSNDWKKAVSTYKDETNPGDREEVIKDFKANQEDKSELKELYYQIWKTLDLLYNS